MQPLKLVVSGPVGAGKTTFIQTLSETAVVSTDVQASEDIGKASTTVALDFGTVHLGDDLLFLFGTPGQERFDFMWDVLCEGALGLMLLVSGSRPADFRHSRHILEFISSRYALPYVVGVTHQDDPNAWSPEDVGTYFDAPPENIIGVDATRPESARAALSTLLSVIAGGASTLPPASESALPDSSFPDPTVPITLVALIVKLIESEPINAIG